MRSKRVYVAGPAAAGLTAALRPALAATGGRVVASPAQADVIVAATRDAIDDAAQQRLVRGLVASGKPVVLLATGLPFDLGLFPGIRAAVASYSDSGVSLGAGRGADRAAAAGLAAGGHPGRGRGPGVRLRHGLVLLSFSSGLSCAAPGCVYQPGRCSPGTLTIGSVFDPQLTSRPAPPSGETARATGSAPAPDRPPLRGVVADWGGVMTNPITETVRAWIAADEIDYASYHAVMKAWVTGAYDVTGADNPIHGLERGECSNEEFEEMLAAQIVRRDGGPVIAAGLLDRMFAATVLSEPMLDLLRRVRRAGLKTAMLSNSWGITAYPADLLPELFDAVVISAQVGMRKPEERIFRHAAGLLGLDPAECVFIDDIEANVQAAEALGMTGVLHTDPAATEGRLAELLGLSQD